MDGRRKPVQLAGEGPMSHRDAMMTMSLTCKVKRLRGRCKKKCEKRAELLTWRSKVLAFLLSQVTVSLNL